MAKNNPVAIWIMRHKPNKDPKFQKVEMLIGIGMSTMALFKILNSG